MAAHRMRISTPGDPGEREADRVAGLVAGGRSTPGVTAGIAAAPSTGGAVGAGGPGVDPAVAAHVVRSRGGGRALPGGVRSPMEAAIGADLGHVRVHTDRRADVASRRLRARAFTTGDDIYFRRGTYQPGTRAGRELLAHELTHVVQQGGATGPRPAAVVQRYFEVEANDFWGFVTEQERKQAPGRHLDDLIGQPVGGGGQGVYEPFTTVGFEAEFAQTEDHHSNPLKGTSHLELTESDAPAMAYTGLPFKLETDASMAVELVTPPFLLPTVLDRPIPDPRDVTRVDVLLRRSLEELAGSSKTLGKMVGVLNTKGFAFQLADLDVKAHHLSHVNEGRFDDTQHRIDAGTLGNLGVKVSEKGGGISTQANVATDVGTFHAMAQVNPPPVVAATASGLEAGAQLVYVQQQVEALIGRHFRPQTPSRRLERFTYLLARNLAGQFAIAPIDMVGSTQEELYRTPRGRQKDDVLAVDWAWQRRQWQKEQTAQTLAPAPVAATSKSKSTSKSMSGSRSKQPAQPQEKRVKGGMAVSAQTVFRFAALLSSLVKDVGGVWLKDTLLNVATDLFHTPSTARDRELAELRALATDPTFRSDLRKLKVLEVSANMMLRARHAKTFNDVLRDFRDVAVDFMEVALDDLDRHLRRVQQGQAVVGASGPTSDDEPAFMSHDPDWITPRQDTLVAHGKAQMPQWTAAGTSLYVTEVRRDVTGTMLRLAVREAGAIWDLATRNPDTLTYDTRVYAETGGHRFRMVTFGDLLRCTQRPFGGRTAISDGDVARLLLGPPAAWAVPPTEVATEDLVPAPRRKVS